MKNRHPFSRSLYGSAKTPTKNVTAQVKRQRAKLARLDEKIGYLMSQRVSEEEKLAVMLGEETPQKRAGDHSFQMECELCAAVTIYENCAPDGADDLAFRDGWTKVKGVAIGTEVERWRCPKHAEGK